MADCRTCGRRNPEDARFCAGCGTELRAPAVEEVRKTVTVVFCDLVGSTALGERLDPESVRSAVGRYFDEARAAIERHGGTVEKFIGDAVMAVFGIPRVHEDDAVRAVRAAVELRDAVRALGDELESELGVRIAARIGIATGEVVAGDPSSGQAFATGDVVNVAARLEQAAAPGEILVGGQTRELLGEAVRVEDAGALELKGKSAPVPAWRVLELTDLPALARTRDAPFVGRERELAALVDALGRAVESRTCRLCTVVGPPGIGKSRLVEEFAKVAGSDGHRVVVGRCLPYGEGITYWPLAEIVRDATGDAGRLEDVLGEGEDPALAAGRIAGALGIAEPSGAPEEIFWAFRKLFEALARERPLVAIVDELQWAESTLLDLLEYLVTFAVDAPILLLCLTRPELFDRRPSWSAPRLAAATVMLEPLAGVEASALADALAAARGVGEEDLARIVDTAEGNPLFLEQLLAHRTASGDGDGAVPPTIQALLAARIDALQPEERAVLFRAAIEGKSFHRGALAELLPEPARVALGARLIALVRQDLIRPDRSQFPGDDGFRFVHSLIHDAAYEAAPKELRAEAHERYAEWLERRAGDTVTQYEEILGYHLEQAHRLGAELRRPDDGLARRAAERLAAAGERALARGDVPAAVNLLERAGALAALGPGALYSLGIAHQEAGELERADRALSDAITRAESEGDRRLAARASLERLVVRELTGRATPSEIRAEAESAIAVFEALGDDGGLAKAWLRLADAAASLAEEEHAAERALLHARRAGEARDEEVALFTRLSCALYGARPVSEVTELCERLLGEARGPLAEVGTLEILAALRVRSGEATEGRDLYRRADELYRQLGMKHREAVNWQCWGRSELAVGNVDLAETAFRRSVEEFEEMGDLYFTGAVLAHLAHALCSQGRYEEAAPAVERAQELVGDRSSLVPSARARVLAGRGDPDAAIALAQEAVSIAAGQDWPEGHALVLVSLAEVHRHAGRASDEAAALREALALYERKGIQPAVEQVRGRLDELEAPVA